MCAFSYVCIYLVSCSCNLEPDLITLIYEPDLDILKMYLHTKTEVSRPRLSKHRARARTRQTDRQTHRQTQPNGLPQSYLHVVKTKHTQTKLNLGKLKPALGSFTPPSQEMNWANSTACGACREQAVGFLGQYTMPVIDRFPAANGTK